MYNANALNTLYNPSNAVLPNTDIQVPKAVIQSSLGLRQIQGFEMVQSFQDTRKSPDWEYMHQCSLIDKNPPASWSRFADTASLVKALYADLMNNPNDPKNVYGLSVALLRHWREISKS